MANTKSSSTLLMEPLTRRELTILTRLVEGKSNNEIAALETLALPSVKWYIQQIYAKLGVNNRRDAAAKARELLLVQVDAGQTSVPRRATNNLPASLTSFIGREKQIAELTLILKKKDTRLVTLTGSGGTGKTRLALQVAADVLDDFQDGVWLVELAQLADPLLVPRTVIAALGLVEQPGKPAAAHLADYLREKKLLLILDNCEHLVAACAGLAALLLHSAPHLTVLATSREILGVAGEITYRVPPLEMPDPGRLPSLEELAHIEAVRLFVERARLVNATIALTPENAHSVAQITRRLDGIPLALELAAARVRLLSVEQIAQRLNDVFRLLTGGSSTVLPRHQTLRALIDWSYRLLSGIERCLLRRLTAFSGGWTLEGAEQVCAGENEDPGAIQPEDVVDLLGELVDKSLVLPVHQGDREVRFTMLETVRQYAHEKLVEEQEAGVIRACHLRYYRQLAHELAPKIRGREQIETLDRLELELSNLRLALAWGQQTDIEAELALAADLRWFWHIHSRWTEAIEWLERGLDAEKASRGEIQPSPGRAVIRAEALSALGFLLDTQRILKTENPTIEQQKAYLEESIALFQASGSENSSGYALAVLWLGFSYGANNEYNRIQTQEALRIFRKIGDPHGMAECLRALGESEMDPVLQRKLFQEQLAVDQAYGDIDGIATANYHLSMTYFKEAEWEQAVQTMGGSIVHYRRVHNQAMVGRANAWLGFFSGYRGDPSGAEQWAGDALAVSVEVGNDLIACLALIVKCLLLIPGGLYSQAGGVIEQAWRGAKEAGIQEQMIRISAIRARLARLQGDAEQAKLHAQEGLEIFRSGMTYADIQLELAHQAMISGDMHGAEAWMREGIQCLIQFADYVSWNEFVDGLALLAAHQDKPELAARLFGTRWYSGYSHWLSPTERASRNEILEGVKSLLGEERFDQLSREGSALTFMQMLAIVQEFLGLNSYPLPTSA